MANFVVCTRTGLVSRFPAVGETVNENYREAELLEKKVIVIPPKGGIKGVIVLDEVIGLMMEEQSNIAVPQPPRIVK